MDKNTARHDKVGSKLFVLRCGENDDGWCGDSHDTDCVPHGEKEGELDHCTTNWEVPRECVLLRVAAGEGCHGDGDCIRYHAEGNEIQADINVRRHPSHHRLADRRAVKLVPSDIRNEEGGLEGGSSNPQ